MRLKSFTAKTAAEAMAEVRRVLGDDAVIVATREEGDGVRVTAALDARPQEPASDSLFIPVIEPHVEDSSLEVTAQVIKALEHHAVPKDLIERISVTLEAFEIEDPILALAAALDTSFQFQPLPETKSTRPLMFVGPPGAGKTLTVAKIATKLAMKGDPVSVITTDTERAGGIDQLAAFTRLLNVDLLEVEDAGALPDAISVRKDAQVIIDTAGQNPFDPQAIGQLGRLVRQIDAEAVLVLPAGLESSESGEIATVFQAAGATRLLITRLDMTRRFGNLLAAAYRGRLRFCEAAGSSSVTVPLSPLNPVALARLILPESQQMVNADVQTGTGS